MSSRLLVVADEPSIIQIFREALDPGGKAAIQRPLVEVTFRSKMDAIFLRIQELGNAPAPATEGAPPHA